MILSHCICSEQSDSTWFSKGIFFFRYNPQKFAARDEDDSDMEANFDDIMREEKRRWLSLPLLWTIFCKLPILLWQIFKIMNVFSDLFDVAIGSQCKNRSKGGRRAAALDRGGGEARADEKDDKKPEAVLKYRFLILEI